MVGLGGMFLIGDAVNSKHQLILAIIAIPLVACGFIAYSLGPLISAYSESYRWQRAEAMVERRLWQQTEYEAQLTERTRQAEQTEAMRSLASRVIIISGAVGLCLAMIGGGYWAGRSLYRRAVELPPLQRVEDGLILVNNALYDRYSGMSTIAGQEYRPSLEHAQAYAIAKSAGREHWARLGYMALSALPGVVGMLRDNGVEPPQEAVRVLEALPRAKEG